MGTTRTHTLDTTHSCAHTLTLAPCVIFFLPWCITVGATITLHPCFLMLLVGMYRGPWRRPLHRLAHHALAAASSFKCYRCQFAILLVELSRFRFGPQVRVRPRCRTWTSVEVRSYQMHEPQPEHRVWFICEPSPTGSRTGPRPV